MKSKRNAQIFLILIVFLGVMAWYVLLSGDKTDENAYLEKLEEAKRYEAHEVYLKANDAYQAAYTMHPSYETAMAAAASAKTMQFYSDMEELLEAAIGFDPTQKEPYELLMQHYFNSGEYAQALGIYQRGSALTDRTELDRIYGEIHGGYEEGYINIEKFFGWHYSYGVAQIGDKQGIVTADAGQAVEFGYEEAGMYNSSNALVPLKSDGKWQYCTAGGMKNSLADGYDVYGNFGNGFAPVAVNGKYGYIDTEGNCYDFGKEAWVSFDTVEKDGFPAFEYDYAGSFTYGVAAVKKGEKWALIGTDMKLKTDFIFDDIILNPYGYCANGQVVIAKQGGAYQLYSLDGAAVGGETFEDAKPFEGDQPAAVCQNGKWGFISNAGQMVVTPQYEDAQSFSAGYAPVLQGELWGYIDQTGAMEIEPVFSWVSPFSEAGIAFVQHPEEDELRRITLYEYME